MKKVVWQRSLSRRDLLKLGSAGAGLGLLAACSAPAAPATSATQATPVKPAAQVPAAPQVPATAAATTAATQAPAATKAASSGPRKGGTFTMAKTSGINEFNPVNLFAGHLPFLRCFYNTLAHYDSKLQLQPELAERWDISADGKTVTLKLREGVKYHSGREFTSEDVKFAVEWASTDNLSTMRSIYTPIKSVGTPAKYVAELKFDTVNPGVYDILDTLYMSDKETISQRTKTTVGTGPFRLEKYVPNDHFEAVANKDYWEKGKPYLDKVVVRQIPDLATLAINLETGAADCIWQPNNRDLVRFKDSGGKFLTDMGAPGAMFFAIEFNVKATPFNNKNVRQAIAWSIDRSRFCKTTLQGLVEPTCLMWPKHSWAYFPDLEGKIGYDLNKAAALLKAAGFEKGFDCELLTASNMAFGYGDLAQMLQADLKKININAKISDLEPGQYDSRIQKGDITMMCHTYGRANRDPGSMLTGAKAWYNEKQGGWTHLENAQYDKLRDDLQSTLDAEKRKQLCRQIQELALDECFVNPVTLQQRSWAYASHVKSFGFNMDNALFVSDIRLDK